jgi:hypothetical protein
MEIVYDIQGDYGFGWEHVDCVSADTLTKARELARAAKQTYEVNEPDIRFRIRRDNG